MSPLSAAHFVGASFDRWPELSGIGAFIRVTRLNRYLPQDYRFAFGMSVRRQDDLNYLMAFSTKRKEQLALALEVPGEVQRQWDLSTWLPFQCDESVLASQYQFRFCTECLRYGYHSLIQQLPWVQRCPWHGVTLRTGCQKCGASLRLDGVSSGAWLGICKCGYDHVNEAMAVRGFESTDRLEQACRSYLEWASARREQTLLIAPIPSALSISVLANAFQLPPDLVWRAGMKTPADGKVHRVDARPEGVRRFTTEDVSATLSKLENLVDTRGAMIEAPGRLAVRIASAACRLAGELPPGSISDTEMTLFLEPAGATANREFVPARRPSILEIRSLPLTRLGSRSFLNLHCISKVTLHVGYRVLQALRSTDVGWTSPTLEDMHVGLSAVHETVARGYAEGIRVVIGRHLPDLYRVGRNRPHLSEPWVLLNKAPGSVLKISVLWARLPHSRTEIP